MPEFFPETGAQKSVKYVSGFRVNHREASVGAAAPSSVELSVHFQWFSHVNFPVKRTEAH